MSRRAKRRHAMAVQRAGGITIPNQILQAAIAQQGLKQVGKNNTMFSPGQPLETQPGANPKGLPRQWEFPIAYNTFGVDRTLNNAEMPSFQQLRNLAEMYEGIMLCEKVWLDLIPKLKLQVKLRPELEAQGAKEQTFQKEIATYQRLFEKPDGLNDFHSWMRIAVTEQLQIDALYIYKQRDRANRLMGLQVVQGDTMKPLLDDRGAIVGYQQFPWGIPGQEYTLQEMLYFRESPRANSPYGKSRVERIMLRVNQALRKEKKDLAYFTEGNVPFALMETPEASNWTPDQIDAFEQMWNALIAGSAQQQVRVKFTQPGMKYTPLEQYQLLSDFDQFILNIATAAYGVSMADLSFTGDIHKSSDDGQQNMLGRRTLYPLTSMYAMLLTGVIRDDFQDDRFMVVIGGFEEAEDISTLATAYKALTDGGILGLSNAAKILNLPEDPGAPHIGRVFFSKDGPIFLDDMASDEVRKAALNAKMAGFELASHPPDPTAQPGAQPGEEKQDKDDGKATQPQQAQASKQGDGKDTEKPSQERAVIQGLSRANDATQANDSQERMVSQKGSCDCEVCRGNHGKQVEQGPPYHDGCDCMYVPEGGSHEQGPQQTTENNQRLQDNPGRTNSQPATRAAGNGTAQSRSAGDHPAAKADYKRWRTRALEDTKAGRAIRSFSSEVIPGPIYQMISSELVRCTTADEVRDVFTRAQVQEAELVGGEPRLEFDAKKEIWEPADTKEQLDAMRAQSAHFLRWDTGVSNSGVCPICAPNDGVVVRVGDAFPSGHKLPQAHINCQCNVDLLDQDKKVIR